MSPCKKDDYGMSPTCVLYSKKLDDISHTVQDIHKRLFIDNGEPCIQSKVRRLDGIVGAIVWVVGVLSAALITAIVGVIITGIRP
jgi:hypothetical protein